MIDIKTDVRNRILGEYVAENIWHSNRRMIFCAAVISPITVKCGRIKFAVNVLFCNSVVDRFARLCVRLTLIQQATSGEKCLKSSSLLIWIWRQPALFSSPRPVLGPETSLSEGRFGRNAISQFLVPTFCCCINQH